MAGLVPLAVPPYVPLIVVAPNLPEAHKQLLEEYNDLIGVVNDYLDTEGFVETYRFPQMGCDLRNRHTDVATVRTRVVSRIRRVFTAAGGVLDPIIRPPPRLSAEVARILDGPRLLRSAANGLRAAASNLEREASSLEALGAPEAGKTRLEAEQTLLLATQAAVAAAEDEEAARDPANIALAEAAAAAEVPTRVARRNNRFPRMSASYPYPLVRNRQGERGATPVQLGLSGFYEAPQRGRGRRGRGRGRRGRGN